MRRSGRLYPACRVEPGQFQPVTGIRGQLFQIKKLSAAISITEWMNVVHITDNFCCFFGKCVGAQPAEKPAVEETAENIRHASLNEPPELERMASLGNFDRPQLPGPFINILKQMTMNILEMRQVKLTAWDAFRRTLDHKFALEIGKPRRVSDSKFVDEDSGAGIYVGVVPPHWAANGKALARR